MIASRCRSICGVSTELIGQLEKGSAWHLVSVLVDDENAQHSSARFVLLGRDLAEHRCTCVRVGIETNRLQLRHQLRVGDGRLDSPTGGGPGRSTGWWRSRAASASSWCFE
jgi:hypothetical protein